MNIEDITIPLLEEDKKRIPIIKFRNMRDNWLNIYKDKNGRTIIVYKDKTTKEL